MELSPKKLNQILKENKFSFKKKYGQNFIIDNNIIQNIINKSNIDKETMIIEIGPGAGSLTKKLGEVSKNVLAYEIDEKVKPILEKNIYPNTEIIYDDFLKRDIKKDLEKYNYKKLYVVSNLPYYITTPIVFKLIEEKIEIQKIVVMVQKEVGDRFNAKPKTKQYNALSVIINYYFKVKKILDVSKNVFIPKPNVDSIVISMTKNKSQDVKNEEYFIKLVKDSFHQKRKTLRNNLKSYDLTKIEKVLKKHGLTLNIRAEELPVSIFIEMSNEGE